MLACIHPQLIITTLTPTHSPPCEESQSSRRLLSHLLLMVNMEQTVCECVFAIGFVCLYLCVGVWYGVMNSSSQQKKARINKLLPSLMTCTLM